jgi:serine/threonine-protein kinase
VQYELLTAHLTREPPRPGEVCRAVSPGLEAVILRALAKERKQRFQSAAEMENWIEFIP